MNMMMMQAVESSNTRVVHCLKDKYDVYIGRWNPRVPINSKWANPFVIGKDGTREEVIKKYREYITNNSKLLSELHELRGKTLGCWCKPNHACHGDVLVELIDRELKAH